MSEDSSAVLLKELACLKQRIHEMDVQTQVQLAQLQGKITNLESSSLEMRSFITKLVLTVAGGGTLAGAGAMQLFGG